MWFINTLTDVWNKRDIPDPRRIRWSLLTRNRNRRSWGCGRPKRKDGEQGNFNFVWQYDDQALTKSEVNAVCPFLKRHLHLSSQFSNPKSLKCQERRRGEEGKERFRNQSNSGKRQAWKSKLTQRGHRCDSWVCIHPRILNIKIWVWITPGPHPPQVIFFFSSEGQW